jgi:hypothetical protein
VWDRWPDVQYWELAVAFQTGIFKIWNYDQCNSLHCAELESSRRLHDCLFYDIMPMEIITNGYHVRHREILKHKQMFENGLYVMCNLFLDEKHEDGTIVNLGWQPNCCAVEGTRGNSFVFEDALENYWFGGMNIYGQRFGLDVGILIAPSKIIEGRFKVSLFTANPGVDVSMLCQVLGGGGHEGAAGADCLLYEWRQEDVLIVGPSHDNDVHSNNGPWDLHLIKVLQ